MEAFDAIQSKRNQLENFSNYSKSSQSEVTETSDDDEFAVIEETDGCASNCNITSAFQVGEDVSSNEATPIKLHQNEPNKNEANCLQLIENTPTSTAVALNKRILSHRFKESNEGLRNFNSLPLFLYTATDNMNDNCDRAIYTAENTNGAVIFGAINYLPLNSIRHHAMLDQNSASNLTNIASGNRGVLCQNHRTENNLMSHHSPYTNTFPLHHSSSHHHLRGDQTKSLQELQNEVGALLEFRDLVIETFPDLKHKMASISSSTPTVVTSSVAVSGANTLVGGLSNTSLISRREWEPGIRVKRTISNKESSTSNTIVRGGTTTVSGGANIIGELSSTSLSRSRSNSHSGKKEPKSGENNNGSVVQDSGFSTETSSSKEGHSASSNNGVTTGPIGLNRLLCAEPDDELLNLLDVIHRKSNRLREEVEQLQNYERQNLHMSEGKTDGDLNDQCVEVITKSSNEIVNSCKLTPKTFREHVERLNKEDIKQLRKERDRLLDKLAEMEAETLTGRIKAAKMNDQVEELTYVKKDLEEQLKLAMAQKLELTSRVQQLQQQQQLMQNKSSSGQLDISSYRNFSTSGTTALSGSTGSTTSYNEGNSSISTVLLSSRRLNAFQTVANEKNQNVHVAFHQSAVSDNKEIQTRTNLGRLDGIVSTPGARNAKCRIIDSKKFDAILLETSVIELQRHLLTLTVQNQVLIQKLEQATKFKTHLVKRLDKSKENVEDLRFQLEEKNIELEGTKAQLRVLESRINSATPSSSVTNSSYLHSQNDYETNRSSTSTMLLLSRRNNSELISRADTPTLQVNQIPPPIVNQICTPSMKAMVPLLMDDMQQHSSSTESAQDQEEKHTSDKRTMSTEIDSISPFEQSLLSPRVQKVVKKFSGSKPSKIPLPGSKTVASFIGKPPSGRPYTSNRSPQLTNFSSSSNASSNKSFMSRSTGNLLYNKSPNSLKRADSAQSIRKDSMNTSLSTNTSRSSTSSSIPLASPPFAVSRSPHGSAISPSSRILQNSPIPKPKRESLTSRMRQLDSLPKAYNTIDSGGKVFSTPCNTPIIGNVISSTPKSKLISTQTNSILRKDLQNSCSNLSNGSQQFLRRGATGTETSSNIVGRRFSATSIMGTRVTNRNSEATTNNLFGRDNGAANGNEHHSNISGNPAADSDSGKVRTLKSTFLGWLKI